MQTIMTDQFGMDENDPAFGSNFFLFHGDQKTVDRIRSSKTLLKGDHRPFDRLDWVHAVPGYWHLKYNVLELLHEQFWQGPSPDDSTLHASAAHWSRKNLNKPHGDFRALEQLIIHSFQARIVSMFVHAVQQMNRSRHNNASNTFEAVQLWIKSNSAERIVAVIDGLVNEITITPSIEGPQRDQEYENHRIFLRNTIPYLMLKSGIKYGDIGLIRVAISTLCVLFQATSHSRYARELLLHFRSIAGTTAEPDFQRAVMANALVNDRGQRDSHFEKDRRLEHWNKVIKDYSRLNRTSNLPFSDLLKKAALLAPQNQTLNRRFLRQCGARVSSFHAKKPAGEDIRSFAMHLWQNQSTERNVNGRSSKFQFNDPLILGMDAIDRKVASINRLIENDPWLGDVSDEVINENEPAPILDLASKFTNSSVRIRLTLL
jgi:hypothetical protein